MGHLVVVRINGIISGDWSLRYDYDRLRIEGVTGAAVDGFTGVIGAYAPECQLKDIQAGEIYVPINRTVSLTGTIKLTGTGGYGIHVVEGSIVYGNPEIVVAGTFVAFIGGYGRVSLGLGTIRQEGTITYQYLAATSNDGYVSLYNVDTSQLSTAPTVTTFVVQAGGKVYTNTTLPGGNSILVAYAAISDTAIGTGQKWKNVTASRAANTTYTNTTGKPIEVAVLAYQAANQAGSAIMLHIDGINIDQTWIGAGGPSGAGALTVSGIVPHGSTYKITVAGTNNAIERWSELR
jgi:hypothetical protein